MATRVTVCSVDHDLPRAKVVNVKFSRTLGEAEIIIVQRACEQAALQISRCERSDGR